MPHRLILSWLAWSGPALAADPFAWSEPPPDVQLERDRTVIPLGKGALFVPSLTGRANEPGVILVDEQDDSDVLEIRTGERVLLEPGSYVVIVSTGSPGQGVGQAVEVREGETTVVPVRWGALRIEVVDDKRIPHRGAYELIRADTREPYGTGFGADTLAGETLSTWLLPPGVYRIVRPGGNYRALRDFATVYVPESGFVRYRLVLDPDTGEFQGSGVLLPDEFGSPNDRKRRWTTALVVGADGSLTQSRNTIGVSNQLTLSGALFVDGQLAYNTGPHATVGLLQVAEGASRIDPQEGEALPIVKTQDDLRLDLLYTYYLRPWIGPYVRASGETQAFETRVLATEDTNVLRTFADGSVQSEFVAANATFFVAEPFEPTVLAQGAGINTRVLDGQWVTLAVRLGLGLRQNRYAGAWVIEDEERTPEVEYKQVASFDQEGVESTVVATAKLPGWAVYATNLELFADFGELGRPSLEWRNTLTLRLTRNVSANATLAVGRLPQVSDAVQLEQSVLLRASWALL